MNGRADLQRRKRQGRRIFHQLRVRCGENSEPHQPVQQQSHAHQPCGFARPFRHQFQAGGEISSGRTAPNRFAPASCGPRSPVAPAYWQPEDWSTEIAFQASCFRQIGLHQATARRSASVRSAFVKLALFSTASGRRASTKSADSRFFAVKSAWFPASPCESSHWTWLSRISRTPLRPSRSPFTLSVATGFSFSVKVGIIKILKQSFAPVRTVDGLRDEALLSLKHNLGLAQRVRVATQWSRMSTGDP